MQPLTPPDSHHLLAAQGWMELGNHLEAHEEIESISPQMRAHPDVLEVRWQVFAKERKWDACADIGLALMKAVPDRGDGWIHRSVALHALRRTEEAHTNLACVADKFSDVWTVSYNLARYCSQLGKLDEAQEWFKKAIVLNEKEVQRLGIDDPDLQPLWDSMSTTIWKKTDPSDR